MSDASGQSRRGASAVVTEALHRFSGSRGPAISGDLPRESPVQLFWPRTAVGLGVGTASDLWGVPSALRSPVGIDPDAAGVGESAVSLRGGESGVGNIVVARGALGVRCTWRTRPPNRMCCWSNDCCWVAGPQVLRTAALRLSDHLT